MPMKPLQPCKRPGCRALTRTGWCEAHLPPPRQDTRLSAHQRGYTYRWSKASKAFLAEHPWCAICEEAGRSTSAVLVDHITPHRGNMELFWKEDNWQAACKRCHDRKTAREDGGFGNPRGSPPPRKD